MPKRGNPHMLMNKVGVSSIIFQIYKIRLKEYSDDIVKILMFIGDYEN